MSKYGGRELQFWFDLRSGPDPTGRMTRYYEIACRECGATLKHHSHNLTEEQLRKLFQRYKWDVGKTKRSHYCPNCRQKKPKAPPMEAEVIYIDRNGSPTAPPPPSDIKELAKCFGAAIVGTNPEAIEDRCHPRLLTPPEELEAAWAKCNHEEIVQFFKHRWRQYQPSAMERLEESWNECTESERIEFLLQHENSWRDQDRLVDGAKFASEVQAPEPESASAPPQNEDNVSEPSSEEPEDWWKEIMEKA